MDDFERPPVDGVIEVHDSRNIYKTNKWWCSVVDGTLKGRRKIFVYLHIFDGGKWKRKGKMTIGSVKNWNDIKAAVEEFLPKVFGRME